MTVLTLPTLEPALEPTVEPARELVPAGRPAGDASAPARASRVTRGRARRRPVRRRLRSRPQPRTAVRLTRRGQVAVVAVVAASAVGTSLLFGGPPAPTHPAAEIAVGQVVVQPGQTLWSIAGDLAPSADPRDVVDALVSANGLPRAGDLAPGQRLVVPSLP